MFILPFDCLDLLFANPILWTPIPEDLPLLGPKGWLESSLIDWYLLHQISFTATLMNMVWIPCQIIADLQHYCQQASGSKTVPSDIRSKWQSLKPIQQDLFVSSNTSILQKVAFAVQHGNHWFTVVFDNYNLRVYVYNWVTSPDDTISTYWDNWTSWNGPQLWYLIGNLVGWEVVNDRIFLRTVEIRGLSWHGVSLL